MGVVKGGTLEHIDDFAYFSYVDWVKEQEKFVPNIYEDSAGVMTVGYGHTGDMVDKLILNADDPLTGTTELLGISEQMGSDLLEADLDKTYTVLRQRMENEGKLEDFDSLDPDSKLLLLDYEFNLGNINKYPKFRDAVLDQNWEGFEGVSSEYIRNYEDEVTGQMKPLTWRNEKVFEHFIKPRLTP